MIITTMPGLLVGPGSGASAHPALWLEMAIRYPWLLLLTNGVRLDTTVLALAVATFWTPSAARTLASRHSEALALWLERLPFGAALAELLHPPREGDARRAGYVPLAVGVLIFQARWFFVGITELTRARLTFAGQVAMLLSLAVAIYVHGRKQAALTLRRAALVYLGMVLVGVGAAAVMQ